MEKMVYVVRTLRDDNEFVEVALSLKGAAKVVKEFAEEREYPVEVDLDTLIIAMREERKHGGVYLLDDWTSHITEKFGDFVRQTGLQVYARYLKD